MPNFKISAHYANGLLNWSYGKGITIKPDKEIAISFKDFLSGVDPIVDSILNEK